MDNRLIKTLACLAILLILPSFKTYAQPAEDEPITGEEATLGQGSGVQGDSRPVSQGPGDSRPGQGQCSVDKGPGQGLCGAGGREYGRYGAGRGFGKRQKGQGGEKMFQNLIQQLNLTAEQQKQLEASKKEHRASTKEIRNALTLKKMELRLELEKEKIDRKKIDGIASEIKRLLGRQIDLKVEGILTMKQILTPEQFEKLQSMKESGQGALRKNRMGGGNGMNQGSGPGAGGKP